MFTCSVVRHHPVVPAANSNVSAQLSSSSHLLDVQLPNLQMVPFPLDQRNQGDFVLLAFGEMYHTLGITKIMKKETNKKFSYNSPCSSPMNSCGSSMPRGQRQIHSRSVGPSPFEGGWPAPSRTVIFDWVYTHSLTNDIPRQLNLALGLFLF